MTYLYRKATELEKEVIFELYRLAIGSYISEIWGWDEDWQRNDFEIYFKPEEISLVYKEKELVGYSQVENKDDSFFLRMLAIHPEHQRNGIGTTLLKSLIVSGIEHSKSICLQVFKINIRAKSFYEKYGFHCESESPFSYFMRLNCKL